jgi:hypothetical protein
VGDLSWNDPQSRGTPTNVSYGELELGASLQEVCSGQGSSIFPLK